MKISEFVEDFDDLNEAYTFHGDPCISPNAKYREICIGHRKGYDYALQHGPNSDSKCNNPSTPSFNNGCKQGANRLKRGHTPANAYMIKSPSGKFATYKQPPTQPAAPKTTPIKPMKPIGE